MSVPNRQQFDAMISDLWTWYSSGHLRRLFTDRPAVVGEEAGVGGKNFHTLLGPYHSDAATYINQPLLTTSVVRHAGLGVNMAGINGAVAIGAQVALSTAVSGTYARLATNVY